MEVKSLSHVWLFATPWTIAYQAPGSVGFSRQEYWSELPFPSPGDLPDPGIEPKSPKLQADALPSELPGKSLRLGDEKSYGRVSITNLNEPSFVYSKTTFLSSYLTGNLFKVSVFPESPFLFSSSTIGSTLQLARMNDAIFFFFDRSAQTKVLI